MPFDPTPATSIHNGNGHMLHGGESRTASLALSPASNAEAAALAYAAHLDVLASRPQESAAFRSVPQDSAEDALEEALLEVGELLGGLSCKGFAHDLRSHLERVEGDLIEEADPSDYDPALGPNDPDVIFSARLSDQIDLARADDCEEWLTSAKEVLTRVLILLSEARS